MAATIFTAQLGVIVLMAEHPRATLPAARGEATLRLAAEPIGQEQLFKYYFCGRSDPVHVCEPARVFRQGMVAHGSLGL